MKNFLKNTVNTVLTLGTLVAMCSIEPINDWLNYEAEMPWNALAVVGASIVVLMIKDGLCSFAETVKLCKKYVAMKTAEK